MNDVFVSSSGNKHYISDKDLTSAYKDLLKAGYELGKASELAIDIVIGRIEATELEVVDILYQNTRYPNQVKLLAELNSKLAGLKL